MRQNLLLAIFAFLITAQLSTTAQAQSMAYEKPSQTLQFGFGIGAPYFEGGTKVPPIQLRYERAVTDEISVGGIIGYASSTYHYDDYSFSGSSLTSKKSTLDYTYLLIGARGNYHFETSERFDPYGGVTLGYNNISVSDKGSYGIDIASSGILYGAQIGANYYFSDKLGAWAEVGYGVGYLNLGLTLKF